MKKSLIPLITIISLITMTAAFLRFYNLNWDAGFNFHPDERNIAAAVARIHFFDKLNPEFFAYGSLPIYLIRVVGDTLTWATADTSWVANWGKINLIARSISALASTLTIPLIFLIANRLFGKTTAILSSIIATFTVSLIQTAHFGVTESLLTFQLTLITYFSLKRFNSLNYFIIAILLAVSFATKTSAITFSIIPAASLLLQLKKSNLAASFLNLLSAISLIALLYILLSPYTFIDFEKFRESMNYEFGVVRGTLPVPYTLQFTNTIPYLYQLANLLWQMGPVAILGTTAIILLTTKIIKTTVSKPKSLISSHYLLITFLIFPIAYFVYIGSWHTKFIRYMVPILPFLAIASSWLLTKFDEKLKTKFIFSSGIATVTILWALAFFSIYTRPQTRIEASNWIYQNIPEKSTVLKEHWDDGLPLNLPNNSPADYNMVELTIYDQDSNSKLEYLAQNLQNADYLVISSRRLWGTLINLEEKYPITSTYYKLLFNGSLGYKKKAEFSSYPSLLGIAVNDNSSEETFQVYDHPTVIIFANTERFSTDTIKNIINNAN